MRLALLTAITMLAFASNSILTRMAVEGGHMDPRSFAVLRVIAGAVVLVVLVTAQGGRLPLWRRTRIAGSLSLAVYMIGFSLAYLTLDAGLGALILFGVVQMSMFCHGALTGNSPNRRQLAGAALAFGGLVLVLWPGPGGIADPWGALSMAFAGLAWAVYTIAGRASVDPLAGTAANFVMCLPVTALLLLGGAPHVTPAGVLLAAICGGLTSGLGYALWYSVLPRLQQGSAALVQLSVPVIAIVAGAVLLGEPVSALVLVSAGLVLGGIAFGLTSRSPRAGRS